VCLDFAECSKTRREGWIRGFESQI
jgi:hypothetical protein